MNSAPWWTDEDLHYDAEGRLRFASHSVEQLAAAYGTPAYVYAQRRVVANVRRLTGALETTGLPYRLLFALKANRFGPLLRVLHELGVGLDVCSPGEVRWAREHGFGWERLSFTAGSLSTRDYEALAAWPQLWVNADGLTAIRRLAEVSPGRTIGLRVNPMAGYGYRDNPLVRYATPEPTKFGIYADRFAEALALAERLGLSVRGLHCHAGSGFLSPEIAAYEQVLERLRDFLDAAPGVTELNLGGGLGIPLAADDAELDLARWTDAIRSHLGGRNVTLICEPGDYLVKNAGLLLTEVTQVEEKGGRIFVGVNAGFNLHPEPAFYALPLEPVPMRLRAGQAQQVTVAGNINEALDIWARDIALPPVKEGDGIAFLNAGAYGAAMSSNHCLRGDFSEHLVPCGPTPEELDACNRSAWDSLYASTESLVWGHEPVAFLHGFEDSLQALPTGGTFLDAGSGEGRNLPFLLALGPSRVVALDSSASALEKMPAACKASVEARVAQLTATGLDDASMDLILMVDVVETLPCLNSVLREMHRVLKPEGLLLCNFAAQSDGVAGVEMAPTEGEGFLYRGRYFFRFFGRDEARKISQECGFEVKEERTCVWDEPVHPGFRGHAHRHESHVLLLRKPLSGS